MSQDLSPLPTLTAGRYRHHKGGQYEVLGVTRHSETLEPMVLYRPLHGDSGLWVRPFTMFVETVQHDGQLQPRFARVIDTPDAPDASATHISGSAEPHAPALAGGHPVQRWHAIVRRRDPRDLAGWLADDACFVSPIVHAPQHGKALATAYLAAAFRVFFNDSFRYVREIVGPRDAMLEFETDIDGTRVNGVDLLRWNEAGQVVEFKVMIRPLKGMQRVHERMAAMLQAMQPAAGGPASPAAPQTPSA